MTRQTLSTVLLLLLAVAALSGGQAISDASRLSSQGAIPYVCQQGGVCQDDSLYWDAAQDALVIVALPPGTNSTVRFRSPNLQLAPGDVARPDCAAAVRGALWYVPGDAGAADTYTVCTKDAEDAYAWRSLF